jgi:hypothetical protein
VRRNEDAQGTEAGKQNSKKTKTFEGIASPRKKNGARNEHGKRKRQQPV